MAKILNQEQFEATAGNVVPFPASLATDATGNEGQAKFYTAEELKQVFAPDAQTSRTVRDLVAKVKEAYHWLNEIEFKRGDKFTQFCFDQIKAMKESGLTQKQWIAEIHKLAPKPSVEPETIAAHQQPPQPEVTVENDSALTLLNPEVLALYNQSQQSKDSLPVKTQTKLYFTPSDYSNRYQSTEMMVANQSGKEVSFANELLTKFAEMAADNQAWNQAENQKQDVQQRDATLRGMNRALSEFLNENTAYRGLKHQLETGQITPEQVLAMLTQFQGKAQAPSDSNAV